MIVGNNKAFAIVTYISKNTLTILCLHRLVLGYTGFIKEGFTHALLAILILLPVIFVFNRYIPVLIGNGHKPSMHYYNSTNRLRIE